MERNLELHEPKLQELRLVNPIPQFILQQIVLQKNRTGFEV